MSTGIEDRSALYQCMNMDKYLWGERYSGYLYAGNYNIRIMNTFSERVRLTRKAIPEEHCNYREACNSHFYKPILLLVILAFCLVSLFWGNRTNL